MTPKTLDEYLKQAQTIVNTTAKQQVNKPKYRITGFYKETEFKETPIGKIPKQWKIVALERIAEIVNGYTFPLEVQGKKVGKYPFIKVGDMNNSYKYVTRAENYVDDDDLRKLRAKVFPKGTIIFPKIGMAMKLNKFRILGRDALFDNNVAGLIPKNVNNEFLYYYFSGKVNLISLAGTTTVPSITKTRLRKLLIPLPPLEEQWGVAEVLSALDRAIEETERLIGRLERLKRGLMQELLTRGIGHREYKHTPIGKIPKQWKIVKIKDIATFIKRGKTPKYGNSEVVVIKTAHNYPDRIKFDEAPHAHPDFIKKLPKQYYLRPNDILINSTGTGSVGRVGFFSGYHKPCTVDGHITILRVKQDIILPKFVFYYLSSPQGYRLLEAKATGSTNQIELYVNEIASVPLPLPPINEQAKIVSIISSIDRWIELERRRREKFERLKRGLMGLLLTGRVRVRVVEVS